jgi:predicted O-linked N-acetylglucosamine transferase (SPINDLY family)
MSIVVQLNTDLEQRLREKAKKRGIEVNQYISQFLEQLFPNKVTTQPSVSDREATLLQQINLDITPEQWQLYLKLKEKSQKGKLSKTQQEQFIHVCDALENANVKRMAVLAELSQIRKTPIRILMEQLGLAPHYE